VYYDPRGKGTVPSGPNCVSRGESGANFDTELFVSGPQPVAMGVARDCARTVLLTLLPCIKITRLNSHIIFTSVFTYIPRSENKCSAVAEMGDRLTTIAMGRKLGDLLPFGEGELGSHVTQCRLGRALPPYQVAS